MIMTMIDRIDICLKALVELLSEEDIGRRATFPENADIRWGRLNSADHMIIVIIVVNDQQDHSDDQSCQDQDEDYTSNIREIGVHLAAKVFEEAVREKSSMVAIWI